MTKNQIKITDIQQVLDFARKVLNAEAEAILNIIPQIDQSFVTAVELIANCTGNVIVGGLGKSGMIAQKCSATLASTGTPSHFLHPTEAMHGDIGRIQSSDIVILLSYGGHTEEVIALAAILKQDNIPLIGLTGNPNSALAKLATVHLSVGDVTEACPNNLAPTASTTATLALCDALAMAVSRTRDFSADDFKKRHPGGMLGRQMMPITDVLRFHAGKNLPLLPQSLTVGQMLTQAEQYERRAGAVMLVDDSGALSGVFTDGDLRRCIIQHGNAVLDQPVAQLMTRNPRSLPHTALVRDAVQMVREVRVDELPVIDAQGKPIGLLDVQDLIALKVIQS